MCCCKYGFQSDTIVVSRRRSPYCLCWLYKKGSSSNEPIKHAKFIELWTNQKQIGDCPLVQSKGTKTIYFNSIRIICTWTSCSHENVDNTMIFICTRASCSHENVDNTMIFICTRASCSHENVDNTMIFICTWAPCSHETLTIRWF